MENKIKSLKLDPIFTWFCQKERHVVKDFFLNMTRPIVWPITSRTKPKANYQKTLESANYVWLRSFSDSVPGNFDGVEFTSIPVKICSFNDINTISLRQLPSSSENLPNGIRVTITNNTEIISMHFTGSQHPNFLIYSTFSGKKRGKSQLMQCQ